MENNQQTIERPIHTATLEYFKKFDKYLCKVQFHDAPQETYWITERQAIQLKNTLQQVGGYSSAKATIIIVFNIRNGKQYFGYATFQYKGKYSAPKEIAAGEVVVDQSLTDK